MPAFATARYARTSRGSDRFQVTSSSLHAPSSSGADTHAAKPFDATVAALAAAGVPYGVFDGATGGLWWGDQAHDVLSCVEQRALDLYLSTVAKGSPALHVCVVGGRLEPAGVPRLRLAISAHPQQPSRTVVVLSPRPAAPHSPALDRLSSRERAVADLIVCGESTKCIAAKLDISEHTARRHTEHLFTKLGVRTRAAVAALVVASAI